MKWLSGTSDDTPDRWIDARDPRVHYRISDRARRISIKVRAAERRVEVVVPGRRAVAEAESFVATQRDWIDVQLEHLPGGQPFVAGGQVMVCGELYGLGNPGGRARPKVDHARRRLIVPAPSAAEFPARVKRLLIREAREALTDATDLYAEKLDRRVAKVSVRDTSSRWGSSITRGDQTHISYSWRLICAPPWVLDYVCAHEVAHILQPNHSRAFWDVVDGIYDRRKEAERWLKMNGATLHAVGAES